MPLTQQQKKSVLANVDSLSAQQIYDYIREGDVTFPELRSEGNFDATKQKQVKQLIERGYEQDDTDYQNACNQNTVVAYNNYLTRYPKGRSVTKALAATVRLQQMAVKKQSVLNHIHRFPNDYTFADIQNYISQGQISWEDLDSRFPRDIMERLKDYNPFFIETMGTTPIGIEAGYTEVYFWGIPSSGKTCALAAILSTAGERGMIQQEAGTGFGYMTDLMNIFVSSIGMLPESGTRFDETQYLPFSLYKKSKEKGARKIALIELSGEIFECFDTINANRSFRTPDHQRTFNVLYKYLKGPNRKIHFFFIDYSDDGSLNEKGRTQLNYLNAASLYFKNNKIFDKSTDAIYIITTKSDYMPPGNRTKIAIDYLNNHFLQFVTGLKSICKKYSINGGELTVLPFSLGDVFFQRICRKDEASAIQILNILIERVSVTKEGWFSRLLKRLNS